MIAKGTKITLKQRCFRLNRPNARAMINGFHKSGKRHFQCIYAITSKKSSWYSVNDAKLICYEKSALGKTEQLCK